MKKKLPKATKAQLALSSKQAELGKKVVKKLDLWECSMVDAHGDVYFSPFAMEKVVSWIRDYEDAGFAIEKCAFDPEDDTVFDIQFIFQRL